MATKLIFAVLLALFAVQNASALSSLGQGIIDNIKNGIDSLKQKGEEADKVGEKMLDEIKNTSESVLSSAKKEIDGKLQDWISDIKNLTANGPIGNAVKIGQCATTAIGAAVKDGATGFKNVTACVTKQVNDIVTPVKDLIANGKKILTFASDIYKNFSSCFPNGFSSVGLNDLMCVLQNFGSVGTQITSAITGLTNDIQQIKSAFDNSRNLIVLCPRERMADVVSAWGNDLTSFGNCANAVNAAKA